MEGVQGDRNRPEPVELIILKQHFAGPRTFRNVKIQGDQKVSVHLMITIRKVMFKVSPTSLQTFMDTSKCVLEDCGQYSTIHNPNVFCDGHLQIINCVGIV
jgi:hypothetical protein